MLEKPLTANGTTTPGRTEPVLIHFEDLDAMGVVHNARYVLLFERALAAYWTRAGWPFDPGAPRFAEVFFAVRESGITYHIPITRAGTVQVQLWLDKLGNTSVTYGFRVLSEDGTVLHAEGRRVQVRIDPATLRPAPIGPALREACGPLLRHAAAQG
jgi:acyl-CoA thioester hydrolase